MSARELKSSTSESLEKQQEDCTENIIDGPAQNTPDYDFGGLETRKKLEKRLLLKIDLRMSVRITICLCHRVNAAACSITHPFTRFL
jgi:hypothetical protein